MSYLSGTHPPGMGTPLISDVQLVSWGAMSLQVVRGGVILSTTRDAGSTPTTALRAGLLLGEVAATPGRFTAYDPTATDGTERVAAVLLQPVRLDDADGNITAQLGVLLVAGQVKAAALIGLDQLARAQMFGRFIFDDDLAGPVAGWNRVVAKTANYTVTSADSGTIFTTTGAAGEVDFTLPAVARGLRYRFFNTVDQTMKVIAPAGKLVAFNNAAATSVALSTAGNKIGSGFEIVPDDTGSKWLALPIGAGAVSVA